MSAASAPASRTTRMSGAQELLGRVPRWAWLVALAVAVGAVWWLLRGSDTLPHDENH